MNGVSVIKTDEPFSIRRMESQGIVDAMWPLCRRDHALYDEFHPVLAERIDDKHDSIKHKEIVKPRIMSLFHHRLDVIIR